MENVVCMNAWTNGWIDEWIDECTHTTINHLSIYLSIYSSIHRSWCQQPRIPLMDSINRSLIGIWPIINKYVCIHPYICLVISCIYIHTYIHTYQVFNRFCYDQGSRRVDWSRPYITQVCMYPSIYSSIHPHIHLSVCVPACLPIMSLRLSVICLSIYLFIVLSICLCVYLSVYLLVIQKFHKLFSLAKPSTLSIHPSTHLPIHHIHPSIHPSAHPSIRPSIHPPIHRLLALIPVKVFLMFSCPIWNFFKNTWTSLDLMSRKKVCM